MRKLHSGFALVLLTAVCSFGLVIQSAQPAAALVSPIDLGKVPKNVKPIVIGTGKGVSLFGRGSNPAGWALTAGQIAWWGYSNRDSIAEFLKGPDTPDSLEQWCNVNPGCTPPTGGSSTTQWQDTRTSAVLSVTNDFQVQMNVQALTCPNGCTNFGVAWTTAGNVGTQTDLDTKGVSCRRPDGTEYRRAFSNSGAMPSVTPTAVTLGFTASGGSMTGSLLFQCSSASDKLIGLKVLPVQNPGSSGQSYKVEWGRPVEGYPEGEVTFDEVEVTARCKNAVTGETTTIKARSDYGPSGTIVMPSCKAHLGDDWYGTGFTVAPVKPKIDGEPIPDEEWDVPDFLPKEWDEEIPDEDDPDWQPCLGTKNGCSLSLWLDNTPVTTAVDVKVITEVLEKQPDRLKCYYGSKVVPLKNCYPLIAELGNQGTDTELDTGVEVGTGTGTDTGTGTGTPAPKPTAEETQAKSKCFPTGWGIFNPFEWVYKPVKCALEWAFVPPTSFSTRMGRMKAQVENRAPFSWFASLAALPAAIPGGGCPDWRIKVGNVDRNIICGTGMGNAMHGARPVFAVLLIGAAFWPMLRSVMYASFPLVKPTPVSS